MRTVLHGNDAANLPSHDANEKQQCGDGGRCSDDAPCGVHGQVELSFLDGKVLLRMTLSSHWLKRLSRRRCVPQISGGGRGWTMPPTPCVTAALSVLPPTAQLGTALAGTWLVVMTTTPQGLRVMRGRRLALVPPRSRQPKHCSSERTRGAACCRLALTFQPPLSPPGLDQHPRQLCQ